MRFMLARIVKREKALVASESVKAVVQSAWRSIFKSGYCDGMNSSEASQYCSVNNVVSSKIQQFRTKGSSSNSIASPDCPGDAVNHGLNHRFYICFVRAWKWRNLLSPMVSTVYIHWNATTVYFEVEQGFPCCYIGYSDTILPRTILVLYSCSPLYI